MSCSQYKEVESGHVVCFFFFQAEDGIRDVAVTGVQTCALPIFGGPQRSVQVDSSSATAVSVGTVDLHQAGPTNNGSDFAVFGGPAAKPTGVNVGTAGHWIPGANPFGDPFAAVAAPTKIGRASCRERV